MNVYDRIRAAFEERLNAFALMPAGGVAWENRRFEEPGPAVSWLQVQFDPVASYRRSNGINGISRIDGLVNIWINTPLGEGTGSPSVIADGLIQWFKSGTSLESGGQAATVSSAYRRRGGAVDGWWQTPITIVWYAHTAKV